MPTAASASNRLPLGAAALAGTSFPIDRARVARELGFEGVAHAIRSTPWRDRDFAIEFEAAAALMMVHLSRFAEELVLWSSPRFGFVTLADRFCTGSSIMPQKKNPDVPELVRGKSGRVIGHLVALLVLMKAQPLTYNKDNQEDKEPLFDTVDTLADTLAIMTDLVATGLARRTPSACARRRAKASPPRPISPTTSCAAAHRSATRTRRSPAPCATPKRKGVDLAALPVAELRQFSPLVGDDVHEVLTLEGSVASRDHPGGTAPAQVRAASGRRAPARNSTSDDMALLHAQRTNGGRTMKLAFLGLGVMGYPMAGHLARAGHDVTVYNRRAAKAAQWVDDARRRAARRHPAAAAQDARDRDDVRRQRRRRARGRDGRRRRARRHGTRRDPRRPHDGIGGSRARSLRRARKRRASAFLDAPVSGGQAGAENGKLTIMVGGDADGLRARGERARDLCARGHADGRPRQRASSPRWSTRSASRVSCEGLSEGIHFAMRAGLDAERVLDVISKGAAQSWQMENRGKTMVADKFDFGFAVDWMRKDLVDLPCRGAAQRRDAAGDRDRRPVLRASAGARRRPLGHVEPHPAPQSTRSRAMA